MNNLEIQINKSRIVFLIFAHLLSLLIGILIVYNLYKFGLIPVTLILVLSVFLLIFPFVLYLNLKVINSTDAGLIINDNGITDNIQVVKFGQIEWGNIKGYRVTKMFFSDLLLLDVIDNNILQKKLSKRQKNIAQNNLKKFGTSCVINLSNLKHDKEGIIKIISEHIKKIN